LTNLEDSLIGFLPIHTLAFLVHIWTGNLNLQMCYIAHLNAAFVFIICSMYYITQVVQAIYLVLYDAI